jgi:hypothetical protein
MYSVHDLLAEGFPHSDIRGSTIARISPRLFAACHVLHRLLAPRHPPNALITLENLPTPPARRTKPRMIITDHRPPGRMPGRRRHYSCLSQLHTHSDKPSHPTAKVSPSRQGGQSIRQIRFTVSKNMPSQGLSAPSGNLRGKSKTSPCGTPRCDTLRRRSLCTASGGLPTAPRRARQWRLADSNR